MPHKNQKFIDYLLSIKSKISHFITHSIIDGLLRFTSKHLNTIFIIGFCYIFWNGILVPLYHLLMEGNFWLNFQTFLEKFISQPEEVFWYNLTTRFDHVTIWLAILTFLYTSRIWRKELQDDEEIEIILICEKEKILLPVTVLRKNCTRAEIQGLLRIFFKNPSYDPSFLRSSSYFNTLRKIALGEENRLEIIIPKEDKDDDTFRIFKETIKNFNQH